MPAATVTLGDLYPAVSTPIKERAPRPNPWSDLFKEPLCSSGYSPTADGQHCWKHAVASYTPCAVVDELHKRRFAALEELADLLQQEAKDCGGQPEDWKVVVLSGWWLRETLPPDKSVAYIDCTYAIVPRDAEVIYAVQE